MSELSPMTTLDPVRKLAEEMAGVPGYWEDRANRFESLLRNFAAEQMPPACDGVDHLVEELFVASRQRAISRSSMAALINRFLAEHGTALAKARGEAPTP